MEFENIQNNLEFNQNNNDYQLENNENELLISNEEPQASFDNEENELSFDAPYTPSSGTNNYEELNNLPSINDVPLIGNKTTEELGIEADNNYNNASNKPKINDVELKGNLKTEDLKLLYEKLLNLPSINNVPLVGNKTTEDLGIEVSGGGTDINIIDVFNFLKKFNNNDIYNANAVNSSVDWIIQAILEAFNREVIVNINVVVNPQNFQIISIDGDYSDVVNAVNLGGIPRIVCQLAGTNIRSFLNLAMITGTYAFFTATMKVDLGAGEMKYLLGINISERNQIVVIEPLA